MIIVTDTGFLSSLLKIKRAELLLKVFEVENIFVPIQVLRELEKSSFFDSVCYLFSYTKSNESWVQVLLVEVTEDPEFGQGELACIKLAKEKDALLLIDDKLAIEKAVSLGVSTLSLAGFLVLCRELKIVSNDELVSIISDLKKHDHYSFSKQNEKLILDEKYEQYSKSVRKAA